ncbi:MAG: DNA polymerase IV [Bacilli bacterium]|jgi:DNA polymerase-4
MSRIILHIDMNAYFASCAQVIEPKFQGKPIAVGGKSSRSIITTASYEARNFGVHSAMPVFQAKKLCPSLIIVSPDFRLYEFFTRKFIDIIKRFSDIIELASIDECYVDVTHKISINDNPFSFVKSIQDAILDETGLKCSIGVAPNKFLAKMASDMKKPFGITVLRKRDIPGMLWPLKIGDMYGVGKKTAIFFMDIGIQTIGDFVHYNDQAYLKSKLGKMYDVLIKWANGNDESIVHTESSDAKSVGNSRTFSHDTTDYQEIKEMFSKLAKSVSRRAQRDELFGVTISITIRYYDFRNSNRSLSIDDPTNDYEIIFMNAMRMFDQNYQEGRPIRLLGITLHNVAKIDSFAKQLSIFDRETIRSHRKVDQIVKEINQKLGNKSKVMIAAEMIGDFDE